MTGKVDVIAARDLVPGTVTILYGLAHRVSVDAVRARVRIETSGHPGVVSYSPDRLIAIVAGLALSPQEVAEAINPTR